MLKQPEARKPEKGESEGRRQGGEREELVGDLEREDRGRPEQAWRVFNRIPPPPTPEFSRLGQDPAPTEFGHQLAKLLPPHPNF